MTMRYNLMPLRIAHIKNSENSQKCRVVVRENPHSSLVRISFGSILVESKIDIDFLKMY